MAVQPVFFHSGQYRIKTDLYQGPLDLLLDLIEKSELDITVLSLAQVTDQFLAYVRDMQEENPTVQKAMEPGHSGFGLRNVDLRIRLFYRKQKGLSIRSDERGTEVSFTIPIRTREEIDHDESISRG